MLLQHKLDPFSQLARWNLVAVELDSLPIGGHKVLPKVPGGGYPSGRLLQPHVHGVGPGSLHVTLLKQGEVAAVTLGKLGDLGSTPGLL